ncbi:MAG: hypothetical protein ABMB14_15145 [Myxococcota bacterium]
MRYLTLLFAGCAGVGSTSADTPTDGSTPEPTGDYDVLVATDPDPASTAASTEVYLTVLGPDGAPVDDLQAAHERIVHTFLISDDLSQFAHLHHEDFYPITVDDLRAATYHFPYAFPLGGDWLAYSEFAHQNVFHIDSNWLTVEGEPAQADEPVLEPFASTVTVGDVTAELVWDAGPFPDAQSAFHLHLTTAAGDVTDIVQWLAADGHGAVARSDLGYVVHTHAWVPGMDQMSPSMVMEHTYDGPDLPFKVVLGGSGAYKMWIQFARSGDPDAPYTIPVTFRVP